MPAEHVVNATATTLNASSGLTPVIVGLGAMIIAGAFLLLLAYKPFFLWLWRKLGNLIYVLKSFVIGLAVYLGSRGIYSASKALFQAGTTYLTLNEVIIGFVYFVGLTFLGMVAMYVGKRIYENYRVMKPQIEVKEEVKKEVQD